MRYFVVLLFLFSSCVAYKKAPEPMPYDFNQLKSGDRVKIFANGKKYRVVVTKVKNKNLSGKAQINYMNKVHTIDFKAGFDQIDEIYLYHKGKSTAQTVLAIMSIPTIFGLIMGIAILTFTIPIPLF